MSKVKLDWDIEGLQFALKEKNIIVIADTLRFSSAVTTAIANGFTIYPVSDREKGKEFAKSIGAEISGKSEIARYSLSPKSFLNPTEKDNKKVVLYSSNGAACAGLIKEGDIAYIGCFLNAKAVAQQVEKISKEKNCDVTIIAAGEKRATETGERIEYLKDERRFRRVFDIEDYLGAGAIISFINLPKNPEAKVCQSAFKSSKNELKELLLESFSGRYLVQTKRREDVEWAAQLNCYNVVPVIYKGRIEKLKDR